MTKKDMIQSDQKIKNNYPRVAYYGKANIGDGISYDCAVLEDGRRGYVLNSLRNAIGMRKNIPLPAFERFCAENANNALKILTNTSSCFEVQMPTNAIGIWVEAGILTHLASGVIRAQLAGKLRANRRHLVEPCLAIQEALSKVGETALIDEATGYQWHREPDALQLLLSRLLRGEPADWERRFTPDYYRALCRLFKFKYGNQHRGLPAIIGKITDDWVYQPVLPPEIRGEIKEKKASEKIHQWLTDEGVPHIRKQIDAVTTIASSSVDYRDFEARCSAAFPKMGQQVKMVFPTEVGV